MTEDNSTPAHQSDDGAVTDAPRPVAADDRTPELPPQIAPEVPLEAMRVSMPDQAEALRREWGGEFDTQIGYAQAAAATFVSDEIEQLFNETGLGDDPRIVRLAARIGEAMNAGPAPGADGAPSSSAPQGVPGARSPGMIQAQIDTLTAREDYWTEKVQGQVRELYLELHGSGPIGVHRMPGDGAGQW